MNQDDQTCTAGLTYFKSSVSSADYEKKTNVTLWWSFCVSAAFQSTSMRHHLKPCQNYLYDETASVFKVSKKASDFSLSCFILKSHEYVWAVFLFVKLSDVVGLNLNSKVIFWTLKQYYLLSSKYFEE